MVRTRPATRSKKNAPISDAEPSAPSFEIVPKTTTPKKRTPMESASSIPPPERESPSSVDETLIGGLRAGQEVPTLETEQEKIIEEPAVPEEAGQKAPAKQGVVEEETAPPEEEEKKKEAPPPTTKAKPTKSVSKAAAGIPSKITRTESSNARSSPSSGKGENILKELSLESSSDGSDGNGEEVEEQPPAKR